MREHRGFRYRKHGAIAEHCETIGNERFVEFRNGVRALEVQPAENSPMKFGLNVEFRRKA